MARRKSSYSSERGAALLEFTFSGVILLTAVFATIDFSRLLWAQNALGNAVREGARYASGHSANSTTTSDIKKLVVYGSPAGGTTPAIHGMTENKVQVTYTSVGLAQGTISVKVVGYQFQFVSLLGLSVQLPTCETTLTAETAGFIPPTI